MSADWYTGPHYMTNYRFAQKPFINMSTHTVGPNLSFTVAMRPYPGNY